MVAVNSMKGSGEFDMNVEGVSYPATVIIAEINVPGIIGLDFVSAYNCEIKMKPCSIVVDGRWTIYQLAKKKGNIGCYGKMSAYSGVACSHGLVIGLWIQKPKKTLTNHDQMAECVISLKTFGKLSDLRRHIHRYMRKCYA